jgi:hypothetical protein
MSIPKEHIVKILWILLNKYGPMEITEEDAKKFDSLKSNVKVYVVKHPLESCYKLIASMIDEPEYPLKTKTLEEWGDDRGKAEQHGDGT